MSKLLPHDDGIEQNVIGAALWSGGEAMAKDLHDVIPRHFYSEPRQEIWAAMEIVFRANGKCDMLMLSSHLRAVGRHEALWLEIVTCNGSVVSDMFAGQYAKRLKLLATQRQAALLGQWIWNKANTSMPIEEETIGELVSEIQAKVSTLDSNQSAWDVKARAVARAKREIDAIRRGENLYTKTGVEVFDECFGGIKDGHYMGIAARPGIGKSALMEQIIDGLVSTGDPTLVFCQDMSPDMFMRRMAARKAGLAMWDIEQGRVTPAQLDEIDMYLDAYLASCMHVCCIASITPEDFESAMRYYRLRHGCRNVFMDHIGHMTGHPREDPHLVLGRASTKARGFIGRHGGYVGMLAHVNRLGAERPTPETVKSCDQVFGDCDQLLLMWIEKGKGEQFKDHPYVPVTFTVGKNRNGPKPELDCMFKRDTMRFVNS